MSRVAFPPSSSRCPVSIPVAHGAVSVEGAPPVTVPPAVAGGPDFNIGDIVSTHWGVNFAEGVVVGYSTEHRIYTVAVAQGSLRLFPAARYADELEAVIW